MEQPGTLVLAQPKLMNKPVKVLVVGSVGALALTLLYFKLWGQKLAGG